MNKCDMVLHGCFYTLLTVSLGAMVMVVKTNKERER